MKVLVVEDDLEINELLGEYLALESIQPLSATTGKEGIRLAQAEHPDAIILDLMLPDIDGFEVAHTLSTVRATYDIPIIILSCMNQTVDRERGFACGALHYMCKPFLPDDLLATLRMATEWRKALNFRAANGRIVLGGANADNCGMGTSLHDLTSDLFSRTQLSDETIAGRRSAVETISAWVDRWNREHANDRGGKTQVLTDYRLVPAPSDGGMDVEWIFTETGGPGILTDAFFRIVSQSAPGKLLGWGASVLGKNATTTPEPPPPPQPWLDLLTKLGGSAYARDGKSRSVRISPQVPIPVMLATDAAPAK